jgi:hypothetical protein
MEGGASQKKKIYYFIINLDFLTIGKTIEYLEEEKS